MTLNIFSLLLFISYNTVWASLSPLCGPVCLCENNDEENFVSLDCSRILLSIVPPVTDWPSNITHLDLSSNNISTLDVELAHSTLTVLDLSNNRIRTVVQNAFGGLGNLKYLNLANNGIDHFEEGGLYGLDQLRSLNLSSNTLKVFPNNLFYKLIGLQELSLADNPLVHLDPNYFNMLINLRWLDVSYIDAYNLNPTLFHITGKLEFLDLSGNEFYDVPIDALRSAKSLKHLRLNENPISFLNRKSFTKLETLEVLELNYMEKLKRVEEEAFSDLKRLRVLEIKYNRHFSFLSPFAFNGLFNGTRPVLEEIDLQGNQLRSLHKSMVPCALLRKFNIQQNPWICDCTLRWIKDCEIQQVYLSDLKCASPSRLADSLVLHLNGDQFRCEYFDSEVAKEELHHSRVVRTVSVVLGVTMLVFLSLAIALVFKWRGIKEWYRKSRKGPGAVYYVRARANPREM